jgi:mono/diheme cytochrome c family protein
MSGKESQDYNKAGMAMFMFSMCFVFVFFFYIIMINKGVDLNEKVQDPAEAMKAAAEPALDLATVTEPWVTSEALVKHGAKLFKNNCAMCHGDQGKGDGAAGAGLNPKPRNLVEGNWTKGAGLIASYEVLKLGIPGSSMAAYAHMKPAERWSLVHFIHSITQNKGNDDPAKVAEYAKSEK